MPVNLRVPPDASKKIEEMIDKVKVRERCDSNRTSISLRIPNRSLASFSDLTSTLTNVTTFEDSPVKEKKPIRRSLKRVGFKSMHKVRSRVQK